MSPRGSSARRKGGRTGVRYLLGKENLTIRAVFALLARLMGLPDPRRRVLYPAALAVVFVSEFLADVYTHRPRRR